MKLNNVFSALVLASGLTAFGAQADQGSGVVTFTGSVIDAPCSVAAGDDDQTIDLGQVSSSAVANGGTSTPVPFYIHLENCSVDTANTVSTTFTGADSSVDGAVLGVTGSATDVGIVMTDGDSNAITLGEATVGQTIQNGDNTLAYSAYIIGGEAPTEGDFTGVTNWTLAYE
ncbi:MULTISPECIES: fimbrial protein [Lelliottia]|uniref:Fimbria A protein n=2 Tax=Lelliottia TaxID=1330545 RepID=A0ABX4ZZF2_9ENTR|nr:MULTISPECIES: fimbrial protein [Lelliottia]MDI3360022.1 fimbrial protein [Lelliottia sp. V89_13]MDK9355701.1 fimbrial protein [Lelliottia sp. V106_16]MDK9365983.1 fimbrial protein [Lelliottia sp. V106_12]MDK9373838.1 fimbrial protein [Lelliottia sp. V106_10]MDK9548248.1 fimbrial protein [Lelliottia sp. V89_5]